MCIYITLELLCGHVVYTVEACDGFTPGSVCSNKTTETRDAEEYCLDDTKCLIMACWRRGWTCHECKHVNGLETFTICTKTSCGHTVCFRCQPTLISKFLLKLQRST